jgi:rhodanese-related sulfurtransferase
VGAIGRSESGSQADGYDGQVPTEIEVEEVQRLIGEAGAALIEVLPEREFMEEHLPGARNVPLKKLTADVVPDLDRSQPVIAYCHDDL